MYLSYEPQNLSDQLPDAEPVDFGCVGSALKSNARSLALDAVGLAASALPGGKASVTLGGLALGAAGLVNSAASANKDRPGLSLASLGLGIVGFQLTSAGPLAKAYEATSSVAKYLPGVGLGTAIIATGVDVYGAYLDYEDCRARK
ncbi:MAG: hypothetical protein U5M50_09845 [Sphingobium sp.]|nr:hypothetical protein [Sphingobium sp.]